MTSNSKANSPNPLALQGEGWGEGHPIRVFTAFSGYDSQCIALDRLARQFPGFAYRLVGWSEIDENAIKAHNALFPEAADRNYGDISRVDWSQVPDFDLFTYSFPCTDISTAGQQQGLAEGSGTRSGLLWECRRAISGKRPRYCLMENVAALVSQKFIGQFHKWLAFMESEGYTNFAQILDAQDYGVAQHRERIFVVSILDPCCSVSGGYAAGQESPRFHFPEPFPLQKRLKDYLDETVDESFYLSDERVAGLIESTLKEQEAGRGFAFKPKAQEDIANALTGACVSRKTDNFLME